jgi:hydrogenase maturation protease
MIRSLVIGYGNTLRSDDGLGCSIARQIAKLRLEGVEVKTCQQLQVELLSDMMQFDRVIFIDAAAEGEPFLLRRIESSISNTVPSAHHLTPETLQSLARQLYGVEIETYLCTVRGEHFSFGFQYSSHVRERIPHAVRSISALLGQHDSEAVAVSV